ncbi:MAG: AIR synthase-related protein, partial [Pseudomonadota bacterium]|nr:AIR synthase-related protein [Pseudomonadota bacterium]
EDTDLPGRADVRGVCEILGLDPLYLAIEGTLVVVVPADQADAAIAAMKTLPEGANAKKIGTVGTAQAGRVTMRTLFGGARIVDMLVGEQLPRIC